MRKSKKLKEAIEYADTITKLYGRLYGLEYEIRSNRKDVTVLGFLLGLSAVSTIDEIAKGHYPAAILYGLTTIGIGAYTFYDCFKKPIKELEDLKEEMNSFIEKNRQIS